MKRRKIKFSVIIAILLITILSSKIYAQQNYGQRQRLYCQNIPELTEDQKSAIETLRIPFLKEMNIHKNKMNELRARKQTLMNSDNADLKEINSIIDQISSAKNQMMKLSAKHKLDIRNLLTESQKVYFDNHHGNRENNRGHGRKSGYNRGNGQGKNCRRM